MLAAHGLRFACPRDLHELERAQNGPEHVLALVPMPTLERTIRRRSSARARAVVVVTATASLLGACASYSERTVTAFADFERGQLAPAYDAYKSRETTGSEFLSGAEAGMVALADGRWHDAIAQFDRAMEVSQEAEREALVSAANLEDWLLSWTLSEGASRYVGEGYERVLLHSASALARLAVGDFTGARVESKRANDLLESEEKLYDKEYAAGGLGHLVSAIVYELDGKLDDAFIDYDRMHAKGVGLAIADRALIRLGRQLDRTDRVKELEQACGDEPSPPKDAASIVVVAGVGSGPYKRANTLPIPTPDGLLTWSVPTYERRPQFVGDLQLSLVGGDRAVSTVVVEDVARVAKENLDDRLALLAAKSAVRAVLKRELTQHLEDKVGILGRIAGDVFSLVTERADVRSWQTLPDTWQAARVFVTPGAHEIDLEARGGECVRLGKFEVTPGETMFVFARVIGSRLYAYPIGGKRLDVEAKDGSGEAAANAGEGSS